MTRTATALFGVDTAVVARPGEVPDGPLVVPDLAADERHRAGGWAAAGYRFLAARPLRVRGAAAGSLCLLGTEPRAWSAEDEQRLADLARWAESELRGADDEALRQRDEVLLAAADVAVFGIDAHGVVTFANPAAGVLLGAPVERIVGTEFHATFHHTRLDGTPYPWEECPSNAALRTGVRQRLRRDAVHRLDGTRVEVEYSGTPLVVGGDVVGVVVTLSDLTEQRAVERLKDEFVSIVSHELRTPLTSIRGSLGLLGSGRFGDLPPKAARLVEIATDNSDRLIRLVNDMLDVERLDSGRLAVDPVVQPLRRVYDRVEDDVSAAAAEAGVAVAFGGADVAVAADAELLSRALTNLVANAVKFSPHGGTVQVAAARDGDEVRVTVTDRGPGVPPERLERIFDRFAQGDASDAREKGGTGLGLAVARSVVEHHGGRLTAASVPGETTFTVSLPAPRDEPRADVVLVEDDPDLAEVLSAAIESLGVHTTAVDSVDEAVRAVCHDRPRLLVLDLALRGGNGYDVVDRLRAETGVGGTPVVVASVSRVSAEDLRRLTLGPTRVVEKGLRGTDVVSAVVDAVREHVLGEAR